MKPKAYELKYCELCGSLGVRLLDTAGSYCQPCAEIFLHYSLAGDLVRSMIGRRRAPSAADNQRGTATAALVPFGRVQ